MDCAPFLRKYARKLDLAYYEYLFENGDAQAVIDELAKYQNADGGFGHALEPDLRLPDSSVLATTVAFQYLVNIDSKAGGELIDEALRFLLNTYDASRQGWTNIPPAAEQYPRAPWWSYQDISASSEWGNPSAEVLGYLLKYGRDVAGKELLDKLSERAVSRLAEIDEPEQHEIRCFIRLHECADNDLRQSIYPLLVKLIKRAANTDPKAWQGYVATPLTFVHSADSPFAAAFDEDILQENAAYLRSQAVDNSHWEPSWEWGQYGEEWA